MSFLNMDCENDPFCCGATIESKCSLLANAHQILQVDNVMRNLRPCDKAINNGFETTIITSPTRLSI